MAPSEMHSKLSISDERKWREISDEWKAMFAKHSAKSVKDEKQSDGSGDVEHSTMAHESEEKNASILSDSPGKAYPASKIPFPRRR